MKKRNAPAAEQLSMIVPGDQRNERHRFNVHHEYREHDLPDRQVYPEFYQHDSGEVLEPSAPVAIKSSFEGQVGLKMPLRNGQVRSVRVRLYGYDASHKWSSARYVLKDAYAWEGNNGLLHMIDRPKVLDNDPLAAASDATDELPPEADIMRDLGEERRK